MLKSNKRTVLVTGGAGFIGIHICLTLLRDGYEVIVLDNFSTSSPEAVTRLEQVAGKRVKLINCDVRDQKLKEKLLLVIEQENTRLDHPFYAVIHLAGLKAVGESVREPLEYYSNHIEGSLNLVRALKAISRQKLLFVYSSSCTVYGDPEELPCTEKSQKSPKSPYGRCKLFVENILEDVSNANPDFKVCALRYFNPTGNDPSGLIGEEFIGTFNLMPHVAEAAYCVKTGKASKTTLKVLGTDYETSDGTCERDYLHVLDVSEGHLAAIKKLSEENSANFLYYNLGTGQPYSVLQMIQEFERAAQVQIPYQVVERRPGDAAVVYSDPFKAQKELDWRAKRTVSDMCRDLWRWKSQNPNGYQKE